MADMLSFKDYATDQEVRWCPGCGDYAILKSIQKMLAAAAVRPEQTVFVSGIGCSSRLPYYLSTYGFHTIHGRAPAVATGIKLANPELDVWVITGDGDGLSIGGNHMMHALRRNIGLHILLFNNEIYGLTKGQYSPTSRLGTKSPTSPTGSVDGSVNPGLFALGSGASMIARCVDIDQARMPGLLEEVRQHSGAAFVEILQNCIVYNKDIWEDVSNKKLAVDQAIWVKHGEPLRYGANNDCGIMLDRKRLALVPVRLGQDGITEDDLLLHDETNPTQAQLLLSMEAPLPSAFGVIYRVARMPFEQNYWNRFKSDDRSVRADHLIRTGYLLDRR